MIRVRAQSQGNPHVLLLGSFGFAQMPSFKSINKQTQFQCKQHMLKESSINLKLYCKKSPILIYNMNKIKFQKKYKIRTEESL